MSSDTGEIETLSQLSQRDEDYEETEIVSLRVYEESDKTDHDQEIVDVMELVSSAGITTKSEFFRIGLSEITDYGSSNEPYIEEAVKDAFMIYNNVDDQELQSDLTKAYSVVRKLESWSNVYEDLSGKSYFGNNVDSFIHEYADPDFLSEVEEQKDRLAEYTRDLDDLVDQAEDINLICWNTTENRKLKEDAENLTRELEELREPYIEDLRQKSGI